MTRLHLLRRRLGLNYRTLLRTGPVEVSPAPSTDMEGQASDRLGANGGRIVYE